MIPATSSPLPRLLGFALALLGVASLASAAPTDANHRFERIGFSVGNVARALPVPGEMRSIVVTKNGEIYRVAGDRLVTEFMGSITVSETCVGDGVLDAAWDIQTNSAIFVTYIAPGATRRFTVARLDITGSTVGAAQTLYSFPVPATAAGCTNLGGGTVMGLDGRLLVGVGDMGNGPGAGQQSVVTGKILRLAATMPGGPAPDNPTPTSPVYCLGVRNPTRMALDSMTGTVWFVDLGPGSNDELNWMSGSGTNYAWPRTMGTFNTSGFRDPAATWATPITPVGLAVNRQGNFGPSWDGDVIVAAAAGTLHRVDPIDLVITPPQATTTTIFTPGTGEPTALASSYMPGDGYAYAVTPMGEFYRLRSDIGPVAEPSDVDSIVPTLVRKLSGGGLEILTERETAVEKYGFYPGSTNNFYSHFNAASPLPAASDCVTTTGATQGCLTSDTSTTSAWARIQMSSSQVDAMPDNAYFVLSALNGRAESMVGRSSQSADRPGGNQTFGCPCPAGMPVGVGDEQCAEPWTLAYGKENDAVIGPVTFDTTWDCDVILVDLSEDWCTWCHVLAPDLEQIYLDYKDRGFTLITLISENASGGLATQATIDSWNNRHDPTNPLILDEARRVMNRWFGTGAPPCNGWPQSHLFDCDGVHKEVICGADPVAIRNAVVRALNDCGY